MHKRKGVKGPVGTPETSRFVSQKSQQSVKRKTNLTPCVHSISSIKALFFGDFLQRPSCYIMNSLPRNRKLFFFPQLSPPTSFLTGFFYSLTVYKLLHQKRVFLLPVHDRFEMPE